MCPHCLCARVPVKCVCARTVCDWACVYTVFVCVHSDHPISPLLDNDMKGFWRPGFKGFHVDDDVSFF